MDHEIRIPRIDKHIHNDGIGIEQQNIINLSTNDIIEILTRAEAKAKESKEKLEMADDFKKHNKLEIPPILPSLHNLVVEQDDDNDYNNDKLAEAGEDEGNDVDDDREVEDEASPGDDFISSNEMISEIIADVDRLNEKR
uniref:Uncharacterized protein n=1 Tax=Amphimedon queenslandica TaxID=400682 RepID=A0A1X7UZY6_AMPQE